ncbi:hypothetical protein [Pseudonocardia nigra]|uniref:hypothetical protein n=1 Tax=Pseudonocardia nigra TaxID=1921578 RepID=UPI001C5D3A96|nr:hypothetical protein [Pseudonocardia nigra]
MRGRVSLAVAAVLAVLVVAGLAAAPLLSGTSASPRWSVPARGAGPTTVEVSADVARHPWGEAVRAQLQRHFDAINAKDYAQWRETVVPERAEALPEPAWQEAYRSSRDGSIRIVRIDDAPGGGVLVRLRFVSTQDVADAPPDLPVERICWRSTLPMTGLPPRIARTGDGSSDAAAC